jgi:hypothetical protein
MISKVNRVGTPKTSTAVETPKPVAETTTLSDPKTDNYIRNYNAEVRATAEANARAYLSKQLMHENYKNSLTSPTSPIPSWYIPAQGYWIGYTDEDGAILISDRLKGMVMQILHRTNAKTIEEDKNPKFRYLTRAEFFNIVANKPGWKTLNAAYAIGVRPTDPFGFCADGSVYKNDIEKRMNLPMATVVF